MVNEMSSEMQTELPEDDWMPTFYIGQHESRRALPVTSHVLNQAHNCNYDMLTTPITTPVFHSRVQVLVSNHLKDVHSLTEQTTTILAPPIVPPLSTEDTPLTPGDITSQLLAFVSPWIDLCSPDPLIANISRQVLCLEVAYAAFCGIEYVFVPSPRLYHENVRTQGTAQYAKAIQEALKIGNHIQIHLVMPMIDHPGDWKCEKGDLSPFTREEYIDDTEEGRPQKPDYFGTWDVWNVIRSICKYNSRLFVALCIPRHLPPLAIQSRWYSEPVKLIAMTGNTFINNAKGYPVLSKPQQSFISRLMRIKNPPWFLLCDVGPIPGLDNPDERVMMSDGFLTPSATADPPAYPTLAEAGDQMPKASKNNKDQTPHLSYVRHLQRKQPPRSIVERYGSGYQDYLQVPLQPLTDNLESMTYEVFEKDPVKYDLYEKAICKALREWRDKGKPASSPSGRVVVAVAGAGRGPLVTRALRASETEGVEIEMWAVEKNPNAYVLLQRHNYEDWDLQVTIVKSDMRSWKGPWRADTSFLTSANSAAEDEDEDEDGPSGQQAASSPPISVPSPGYTPIDILVSELLGSFADNELSPECLDGIVHLLNPTHGISIPSSYTAFLTPIAAPKLHADILARATWDPTAPETPSVVWLHSIDFLSLAAAPLESTASKASSSAGATESGMPPPLLPPLVLPVWSFHHRPESFPPSVPLSNNHNTRYARLDFRTRDRGVCHGLAGYFEAVLYPGIELSTNPNTMEEKSREMISWFPIFFPLKTPIYTPDHSLLTMHLWRQTDDRKVWYEWMIESWGWNMMIGGERKKVRLGQSEVHSSIKGGCMM